MFTTADRSARGHSITVAILALVVATLATATAILFAITFNGPPPRPAPAAFERIAAALRTGRPGQGEPWVIDTRPTAPVARGGDRRSLAAAQRIAALLRAPPASVIALMPFDPGEMPDEVRGPFQVGWHRKDGWRVLAVAPEPWLTRWHRVTLIAMAAALAGLSLLAWLVARAISRPLQRLAEAATRAQAGAAMPPLPTGGAREVRTLTRAIAGMHDRLQRHVEGRTIMLAAIAHDLGTPLSRLAFWLEQLPDAARIRASGDLDEMRQMIAETLAFARGGGADHAVARLDLGSLLDSLVEDMATAGTPVALDTGPRAIIRGDSGALRRLFGNLIDNAVRYGDSAVVSWTIADREVAVMVDDTGPGLGDADPEQLFEPFIRGDPSRNRSTGGTGLGLAIVRTIAERHGGEARLAPRQNGGVRATVTLPLG